MLSKKFKFSLLSSFVIYLHMYDNLKMSIKSKFLFLTKSTTILHFSVNHDSLASVINIFFLKDFMQSLRLLVQAFDYFTNMVK